MCAPWTVFVSDGGTDGALYIEELEDIETREICEREEG